MDTKQSEQGQEIELPKIDTDLICRLLKKSSHTRTEADIDILSQQLRKIKFFEKYNNECEFDVIKECCKQLQLEIFKSNEKVFEIGTFGDKFYIIIEGKVGVNIRLAKQDIELKTVKELKSGESFGEIALIYKKPRLATIQCTENCIFGVLSSKNYQNTLQSRELNKMLKEMTIFNNMALFNSWTQNKLRDLYLNSMWLIYKKGDLVYDLGDSAESLFVIQEGEFVVYTKSNFEKVVGNEGNDEDGQAFNQFKRKIRSKDSSKIQQYLKVRILCQGEYFGEEEILNEQPRQFKIMCNSFEGKVLMIKKAHFLNNVFQDEISRQYILNRLKEKTTKIEERIQNMKNSLKEYKHFLYQDRTQAKQSIIQKSQTQAQIKFDVFNSYEIIDKLAGSKQIRRESQEKIKPSLRGSSTSPLKNQRTLPVLQSLSSFTHLDMIEPSSPSKSQSSIQKQNTTVFGDQFQLSPQNSKQKIRFSVTQQFGNNSPPKLSDTISTTNRNYEMYVIESPDRIQLSPSKYQNKQLMKQLNLLNLNSTENATFSSQCVKRFQSMTEINQEKSKPKELIPFKPQSLLIRDEDLQHESNENKTNLNLQQAQTSQQQTSRTNTSIALHLQIFDSKRGINQNDLQGSSKTNLQKIEEDIQKIQRDNEENGNLQVSISGEFQKNNIQNSDLSQQKRLSEHSQPINNSSNKQNLLQNLQLIAQKDQDNIFSEQRMINNTSSPQKKSILIIPNSNTLQCLSQNASVERVKLKLQLKSGLASVDSTPLQKSPLKLSFNRLQQGTTHSSPAGGTIKPQQIGLSFSSVAEGNNQQNLLSQKQQSFFARKSVGSQFKSNPTGSGENGQHGFNLFSVLDQEDQHLLQRQIQQKRNHQQDLINLKNHHKTYLRQWRQRSTTRDKHIGSSKPYCSLNYNLNKDTSTDQSKVDDQAQEKQTQNHSLDQKQENKSKNFSHLLENLNNGINNDEDFSPYLKKKIKNIVKMKKSTDSALINFGNESKTQQSINKIPVIVKPPQENNIEHSQEKNLDKLLHPSLTLQNAFQEKRIKAQSNDQHLMNKTNQINHNKPQVNKEFPKQINDFLKSSSIIQGDQKIKARISFQKGNHVEQTTTDFQLRKTSFDGKNSKLFQQHRIYQVQHPSATNESFTESLAFQGIPENKKKIFLNMMSKQQVQQYFQKQVKMFNQANLMQNHQTMQNLNPISDDTSTTQTLNLSQPKILEDKKRMTVYTSIDSLNKRQNMNSETEPVNKISLLKSHAFQLETTSPKKSTLSSDRYPIVGINHQLPQFSSTQSSQQKLQESFFLTSQKKIQQHPPSPKFLRISSQPITLQYIN